MDPNQPTTTSPNSGTAVDHARHPMPPTNVGWAVASVIFFWPLAFAAFTHSSNVRPLWEAGDYQGARNAADRVKKLGKIALLVWATVMIVMIVFYAATWAALMSSMDYS
ncbi:MAG TPA: CD225/dispanin family protein [Aldersonia sp.]